jgi:hypothetical protein
MKKKIFDETNQNALMTKQENISENKKIGEMWVCLRKKRSKLPANLYLDDNGTWFKLGPYKRIKFQDDNNDKVLTNNMIPMSIDDNPQILIDNANLSLSVSEVEQIKIFVKNNKELLLKLGDMEIDIFDFIEKMRLS